MYEIKADYKEMRRLTKGVANTEQALKKATISAINKTAVSSRAEAVRLVTRDYKVRQADVRAELKISKAHASRIEARIVGASSPGVPLYKFAPTPKRNPSTRRTRAGGYSPKDGIKVMVSKGARKLVRGAFIARMASGHVGIFRRRDDGQKPIDELFGPSPIRLLEQDRYQTRLDEFTGDTLDKNMEREADFFLKKYGALQK